MTGHARRASSWCGLAMAAVILSSAAAACSRRQPPLQHTFASGEALAAAVLDALATKDRETLMQLPLSEEEFRARVWPELPASRPERNVPFEYTWGDLAQKSRLHLAQTLASHGGRRYSLVAINFTGETTHYDSFRVARKPELIVRDESGGQRTIRLFGSILQDGSQHKLFSYVVD